MAIRNTFKKYERLKREQHIDTLFRKGKAFSVSGLRFVYTLVPRGDDRSPVRAGFSVPKKKHKKSVTRHRLRRLMVEAWRQNKAEVYKAIPEDMQLQLFVIFTSTEIADYNTVSTAMQAGMARLVEQQSNDA
ncbi:MAG: ribonuclease P protein component [Chitinophagales bacterium]|nr:ribonuclease P protein component [Chitinophagaceae bacterium]MCB9065484.1 ribonuclease P protein component [Chitinophagales bacterium]